MSAPPLPSSTLLPLPSNGTTVLDAITPVIGPLLNELKEEVDENCRLLGPFALVIQALLGAGILGSLLLKRMHEKPRRKWKIWSGDVSKQVIGQGFVHSSNVLISDLIARHQSDNPCSLYALNIAVDTTLGVAILYFFIKLSTLLLHYYYPHYRTGDYGTPFSIKTWAQQCAVYVGCLSMMKVVVILIFWAFPILFSWANWCLGWLKSDEAQVLFVMLIFPLIMNCIQFLAIDSIIKSKPGLDSPILGSGGEEDEEARRGFLDPRNLEDDDDDDDDDESDLGDDGGKYKRDESTFSNHKGTTTTTTNGTVLPVPSPGTSSVLSSSALSTTTPSHALLDRSPQLNSSTSSSSFDDESATPRPSTPLSHSYPPVHPTTTPPRPNTNTNTTPTRPLSHARTNSTPKRLSISYGSTPPTPVKVIPPPATTTRLWVEGDSPRSWVKVTSSTQSPVREVGEEMVVDEKRIWEREMEREREDQTETMGIRLDEPPLPLPID